MKIYTKVILDWNPSTKQYEETYAEAYNYEGEVALCQRVGYTGPDLNEILDRMLTGGEIKQRGAEVTRQFDVEAVMAQKRLEQNETKLEIERTNTANTSERLRQQGELHKKAFDDADYDRDFQHLSTIVSQQPQTEMQFDAKMSQLSMFEEQPGGYHPKVGALIGPAITKVGRAKEDYMAYQDILTSTDFTASEVSKFSITGVHPVTGRTIPMTQFEKTNMAQWAVTLKNTAMQRDFQTLLTTEMINAGADPESVEFKSIIKLAVTAPTAAVATMNRRLGAQVSVIDAHKAMRTIESTYALTREPGESLESFVGKMREAEISATDVTLYRMYDKQANITTFTTFKDYSEEEVNKFVAWATAAEKESLATGSLSQEKVDKAGPMTIDRAMRLAEIHGADLDTAGNVTISGQGGPSKIQQTVQGVTTADVYVLQNQFKNLFSGKGAPVNIVHSNNPTGRIKVDSIGNPPKSVGMASQEQYVYFIDETTRVRHSLAISIFKQYFIKGK